MASQGPLYPTAEANVNAAPEDANIWSLNNADADDGVEDQITAATYDSPDISSRLRVSGFGFTIPGSAVIDGVIVEIERRSIIANSGKDYRVQLVDASSALIGTNKAVPATIWPTTSTVATYGGAADTWGASLTDAIVNHANFGVVLACQANIANADVGVDFIRVTVHYTAGEAHSGGAALTGGGVLAVAETTARSVGLTATAGGVLTPIEFTTRQLGTGLSASGRAFSGGLTARSGGLSVTGAGVLTATGESSEGSEEHSGGAQLTGAGVLLTSTATARAVAVQLTGAGRASTAAAAGHQAGPALTGAGVLTGTGSGAHTGAAALTGAGALTVGAEGDGEDMGLATTMDALANAAPLDRKYPWPAGSVETPCVVIGYPELQLDFVYGADYSKHQSSYPVYVLAGRITERSARDVLDAAIEAVPPALTGNLGGAVDSSVCQALRIVEVTVGAVPYLAGQFRVDVIEAA